MNYIVLMEAEISSGHLNFLNCNSHTINAEVELLCPPVVGSLATLSSSCSFPNYSSRVLAMVVLGFLNYTNKCINKSRKIKG